jgi:glycerophosphoryl diester phosphodiesterase
MTILCFLRWIAGAVPLRDTEGTFCMLIPFLWVLPTEGTLSVLLPFLWVLPGVLLATILVVGAVYLFLIHPGRRRESLLRPLLGWDYAHRGLHDMTTGIPENTLEAFESAVRQGYGAELDVRLTKDGQVVVFHDEDLRRLTGVDRRICDLTYEELSAVRITGSNAGIPLFAQVLPVFEHKAPLIVEIKASGTGEETCRRVDELLSPYQGAYCIESFNPHVVRWFRRHRPDTVRGQLGADFFKEENNARTVVKFAMTHLLLNFRVHPDFIAYQHTDVDRWSFRICRKWFRTLTVGWTIASQEEYDKAKKWFDLLIFEQFRPGR